MSESAKRHEENSNLIKEIRATTDAAIRNQGASIKTLEIQVGKMNKTIWLMRMFPPPAPTRSYDQILPFAAWIFVDILQNTNFFRAFTASTSVPTIYIQQFWNTLTYEAKTGAYSFQLDETRFVLDANLLREALEITPIDQAHQFMSPPSGDAIMDFVNELGYTEKIHFVSRMAVNNLYQPWRAIFSIINQCLTSKTSGYDRPRYPVPQMLWGIITSTNVDYAELMWEEFVQAIQTFLTNKNLGSPTKKGKKDKPHVIPYCRFIKLIICHLGRKYNLHQRSKSSLHLAEEDLRLGNLKFVPKGEDDEVFRMPIPNELIKNSIRNAPYYNAYLEMVAKHDQKIVAKKGGKKKPISAKQLKPKPVKEKSSKPAPAPKPKRQTPAIEEASIGPSAQPQDDTSANIVCDSPSPVDVETGHDTDKANSGGDTEILQIGEEQGEYVDNQVNLEEKTAKLDQGQAGSDPGKTPESRPPPEQIFMDEDQAGPEPRESHVALARPNPEPIHDEFMANVYPNVHESLKFPADEHVILEDPLSSSGTLYLIKNLNDAYTIGDPFLNDKSSEDELGKLNVEAKVVSMVTVLIYQASSSVPPLSTPVIDLSPAKPDLPHKINQIVNEVVKEAVHVALQASLRDRFRELPEVDMKEIIHQRMFESGTYKSLPEHVALYKALEASIERANRDEFFAKKDKSRKRRHDDQDPPPPPPDSDPSKKRRHAYDASGSTQPPAPQSLAWKTSDTREAPSSSSRQKSGPHSEQPVKDVPIPDDVNVLDSEDTDTSHLHTNWVIPPNELPKTKNNWANALASSYQDPDEKLLRQTGDMSSFINWFYKRIGKKKLSKADLEGPAFKVV
ncbi:hypothetical protein Tco_0086141 [Tanacetum coccineum]